ncbi:type II toxin-antitoxin system VapB family antitoxin [Ornithinimicrobium sp. Y1847]|uniref:type II toxin-antitoxin system VapB family antitoxin n=1 Tax=unclassified Ornithinimicrobium TaxID=2615080 RepID=UPI003B67963D
MAINIKNDKVCGLIRQAAERAGRPQTSVLEEALERYLRDLPAQPTTTDRVSDILHTIDSRLTTVDIVVAQDELLDLYDERGLPR